MKSAGLFENADKKLSGIREKVKDVYEKREDRKFALKLKQDIKEIPSQLPKERIQQISEGLSRKEELRKDEKRITELKKEAAKIKREVIQQKAEQLMKFGEKTLSKPLLKKPSVSVPSYNTQKLVSQMGRNQGALVQRRLEVPNRLPVTSRSGMFDNEANQEVKSTMKWFMED